MSIIGNIFKYLIVILLIALGLCVILAGVMVLFPGFTLFGLHYISLSQDSKLAFELEYSASAEWKETSTVKVITKGYSVVVRPLKTSGKDAEASLITPEGNPIMRVMVTSSVTGFAWGEIRNFSFTREFIEENGETILKMEMQEPDGWLYHSNALIEIVVSKDDLKDINFEFISNSGSAYLGAVVEAEEAYDKLSATQKEFDAATKAVEDAQKKLDQAVSTTAIKQAQKELDSAIKKQQNLQEDLDKATSDYNDAKATDIEKEININSIDISNGSGQVKLRNANFNRNVNIEKTSGDVEASKDLNCNVKIEIVGGLGKIFLNNIGSENNKVSLNINATNSEMRWDNLYGALTINAQGGYLNIGDVSESVYIRSESCSVNIDKIGTTLYTNNGNGYVRIDEVNGVGTVITNNGEVSIGKTLDRIRVETNQGRITLNDVYKTVAVDTNSGQVLLNWNAELSYNSLNAENFRTDINANSSVVEVNNIKGTINFNIKDNGNARITARFLEVNGTSNITTNSGSLTAVLPATNAFTLNWQSNKNVDIKFGGKQPDQDDADIKVGSFEYLGGSAINSVSFISNSGTIKVRQIGDE